MTKKDIKLRDMVYVVRSDLSIHRDTVEVIKRSEFEYPIHGDNREKPITLKTTEYHVGGNWYSQLRVFTTLVEVLKEQRGRVEAEVASLKSMLPEAGLE